MARMLAFRVRIQNPEFRIQNKRYLVEFWVMGGFVHDCCAGAGDSAAGNNGCG